MSKQLVFSGQRHYAIRKLAEHLSMWMYQEFRAHECAKSVEPV